MPWQANSGRDAVSPGTTILYVLAMLGIHLGFMPLLLLLLPRRIAAITTASDAIAVQSMMLLTGGVIASVANIVAGRISDHMLARHGSRQLPVVIGTFGLVASYGLMAHATSTVAMALAFAAFQLTLNLAFAPLAAVLADHFPDAQKGRVAGLANACLPIASASTALIAFAYPTDSAAAFWCIGVASGLLVLPLLIGWRRLGPVHHVPSSVPIDTGAGIDTADGVAADFQRAWLARLLVQSGAAFMVGYLYNLAAAGLKTPDGAGAAGIVGNLSLLAAVSAVAAAIAIGRLSDGLRRRRVPLAVTAFMVGIATGTLVLSSNNWVLLPAFAVFHAMLAAFLALDSALVAQLVARKRNRATLLGIMNLTNTLPSVIVPGIALLLSGLVAGPDALRAVLGLCAAGAGIAALLVLRIKTIA